MLDSKALPVYTDPMHEHKENFRQPLHTDVCLWLDYYGDLLSTRQREVLTLYFDEDWSLSEIAEHTGLSRQGIHEQIRRGVKRLSLLESSLELAARDRQMEDLIKTALRQHERNEAAELLQSLDSMLRLVRQTPGGRGEHHGIV